MNSQEFRQEIEIKKPRYLEKYYNLMKAISDKGATGGGDYIKFGPFFQTYMYAFMIGYHLGECRLIAGSSDTRDFAPINNWRPSELVDYILMLILSESDEKLGFTWEMLERMNDEECKAAVGTIVRRIEGYANTGLNYIQDKFNNEKDEFRSPNVFITLLRDVVKDKAQ